MSRQIFRQAALERLASPEQLDRPGKLVRPQGWMALAALAAVVAGGSAWAMLSEGPVKVAAAGILFDAGQLMDVATTTPGRIVQLNFDVGSQIKAGDVVAVLARPELELDLTKTKADLADARSRRSEIERFYGESEVRERAAEEARISSIDESQKHVTRRIALLQEKIAAIESLLARKLLVKERLIEAELEISTARERLSELEDERKLVLLKRLERDSRTKLALLDEELKINDLVRRQQRLESQAASEQAVRSVHTGTVAEIRVAAGDVVAGGAPLMTLMRPSGEEQLRTALMYVSPRDGRRIEKGMTVEVVPSTIRKEEFGTVSGIVEEVSNVAATQAGMLSVLRNEQLVSRLSGEGAPIALKVRLDSDPATPSGLRWSSSIGPNQAIPNGTLLDGKVVVDRVPIINLVAPTLDRWLGGRSEPKR